MPQLPLVQIAVPFRGSLHVVPQPPQLLGSELVLTQRVPQVVCPPGH
jgi:hypothetical protein